MKSRIYRMIMLLVFSVAISVSVLNTNAADATETTDSCEAKIVDYTAEEATEYLTDDTYPTLDGYLFAGWYTSDSIPKEDTEASAYAIRSSVPSGVTTVYALFMPSHILDVKAQLSANMVDENNGNDGSTSIRFITTVNSLLYKQVGFEITYTSNSGVKKTVTSGSNKVYDKLYAVGSDIEEDTEYVPQDFCNLSKYFKACIIKTVAGERYNSPFLIKPFWITLDGAKVYGNQVIKSVDDFFLEDDIYVDHNNESAVDAEANGSAENPVKTLEYALGRIKNQGSIHIVGTYATTSEFVWEEHNKTMNITGGTLDFTTLPEVTLTETKTTYVLDVQDSVTFTNITLTFAGADEQQIYANGNTLEIASDVTWGDETAFIRVYGGAHNITLESDTNIILEKGQYSRVFGAGNYSALAGNVNITLSGSINSGLNYTDHSGEYIVYGGGQNTGSNVEGNVNINITDETVLFHRVYGGGHNRSVTGDVNIWFAGKSMGVYGGGRGGTIDGDTYLTMTGGWVEQLFGGCDEKAMTGNTNVVVKGGTVDRRIYGGCYNEATEDVTNYLTKQFTMAWSDTPYVVSGYTSVTIFEAAQLEFDYTKTYSYVFTTKVDNSLCAFSRYETAQSGETSVMIFNDDTYGTHKDKITFECGDLTCTSGAVSDFYDYLVMAQVGGQVYSEGDCLRITPDKGYVASVRLGSKTGELDYYTESEGIYVLPELTMDTQEIHVLFTEETPDDVSLDKYEARIDGAYYDTLVEAINVAPILDGENAVTVTVLKDVELQTTIEIASSITIQNDDDRVTVYRGSDLSESDMFTVKSTGTLTLAGSKNQDSFVFDGRTKEEAKAGVSIEDAYGSTGSLINNAGILKLENVTMQYAKKTSGHGAAINSSDASVELRNTLFADNKATYGGAILASGGTLVAENSTFIRNSGTYGGAVRTSADTTISSCTFGEVNNGNVSSSDGAAIYSINTSTSIVNTKFIGNSAGARGGAIYNNNTILEVSNSKFSDNIATTMGGAIYNASSAILNLNGKNEDGISQDALFDNNVSLNESGNGGGAIYVGSGTLYIEGYVFSNNHAKMTGGAICATGTSRIIKNSTFTGNYTTGDAGHGGAIYLNNTSAATLTGNTFTDNHTDGTKANGGAVCLSSASTNINYDFGWANTYVNNTINGESSQGKDIYIPTTTTELEETETGTGTGTDENIGFGEQ